MLKIRRGKKTDLKNYLKCQLEAFPMESRARHIKYFKQKVQKKEIFVMMLDERYIGHHTFSHFISPPFTNSLYPEELAVRKEFRNKGFGTRLLEALVKEAKRRKIDRIVLDTENNPKNKAIRFYKRHGFKKVGTLKTKYGNEAFYELYVKNWKK